MASAPLSFIATQGALEVYVGEADQWVVQRGSQVCDTNKLRARASLLWLPLLEQDYPTFRQKVFRGLSSASPELAARRWAAFPVQELLSLALTASGSWYWVDLALAWAADVELGPQVQMQVQALAFDPSIPQPTRHRAKRLYYTGKSCL
ncbi:hypothetical protein [Hymenobacter sp. GOD-10R]|uniref:hypothetical protein n=1 Tax=Hymenobacter sp. GOD-10R TaxID=3093922 RepID=UPI002D7A15A1|nr:hypothetical protein [Hymenobacter sp. GOD-10R]WRQ31867.1 hypothetical protein SD425_29425 [Hymenobacter sp. GOD-10R]